MRARATRRRLRVSGVLVSFLVFALAMQLPAKTSAQISPPLGSPTSATSSASNTLHSLIEEALARSPLIVAARLHWQAEMRVPVQESTLPEPQITFQNMAVGNPIPGNDLQTNNFAYFGYGVSQDIPFPGKLRLRALMARKEAAAAHAAYQTEERQVVEQVRETYFNLFYLTKALVILQRTDNELHRVERITRSQYEVGLAQQQDVLKAQLEMTLILKEMVTTREEFEQAQADLKAILGREQDSPEIPVDNVALTVFNLDDQELRRLALNGSPQLKEAEALEAKSEESVKLAREGYIPDFIVAYMYQETGARFPDYYMATLGVKVPLFFWRKQTPALEEAEMEKGSAQEQTHATKLSVLSQLQNQWIAIQTTHRIAQLYADGLIPQAEATLTSAMATYRVGKVDLQTLLSAEVDLLNLKQQYYRTVADHEIAIAKVQQIIGSQP